MIIFLGDIHGCFEHIKNQIKRLNISDCTLIQLGDFGIGFNHPEADNKKLSDMNELFKIQNIDGYVIRGNHDNPDYFTGNHMLSNLKLMPDYSIIEADDMKIGLIGGAISIDRKSRLSNDTRNAAYGSTKKSYWFDELVKYDESKIKSMKDLDILCTHTAPDWCKPNNKIGFGSLVESFASKDEKLLDDLRNERSTMSRIFNEIQKQSFIKNHFYGHFHRSEITINGICTHRLCDINEFVEFN